ncbi:MAG: hypothetical protein AB7F23_04400 [Phycisphaerae bacterium]|jgi:hypothetical protein
MRKALTLYELLAALAVTALILIASLSLLQVCLNASVQIDTELTQNAGSREVLQKLAEDIDSISSDTNTTFKLSKHTQNGAEIMRLEMENYFVAKGESKRKYRRIIWQSDYNPDTGLIVIYRCHSGLLLEDTLVSTEQQAEPDKEIYVPVCTEATHFNVNALNGDDVSESWATDALPAGLIAEISFAEPIEDVTGDWIVPDEDIMRRTISVNRAKEYQYRLLNKNLEEEYDELLEDELAGLEDDSATGEEYTGEEPAAAEEASDEE